MVRVICSNEQVGYHKAVKDREAIKGRQLTRELYDIHFNCKLEDEAEEAKMFEEMPLTMSQAQGQFQGHALDR